MYGEIDIIQFIFTWCVLYSLERKLSLHKKVENRWKELIGKHLLSKKSVIYLTKVNYTSYNYTPCNSTWTCLLLGPHFNLRTRVKTSINWRGNLKVVHDFFLFRLPYFYEACSLIKVGKVQFRPSAVLVQF